MGVIGTVMGLIQVLGDLSNPDELGEKIAIENARRNLWALMGYALKEKLHAANSV